MKTETIPTIKSPQFTNRIYAPRLPDVYTAGDHDYDLVVAQHHREPIPLIVARLLAIFRQDFETASSALHSGQWNVLAARCRPKIHRLVEPSFDPREAMTDDVLAAHRDVDELDLGKYDYEVLLSELPSILKALDIDQAKAVWCILAISRMFPYPNDGETTSWWTLEWLRTCLPPLHHWKTIRLAGVQKIDPSEDVLF